MHDHGDSVGKMEVTESHRLNFDAATSLKSHITEFEAYRRTHSGRQIRPRDWLKFLFYLFQRRYLIQSFSS